MDDLKNVLHESLAYYMEQEKAIVSRLALLPKGKIRKKKINTRDYYYLQFRKGEKVVDTYLGKTIPDDIQHQLAQRDKLEKELKKVREALSMLNHKADGATDLLPTVKRILEKLTAMNLWESGIEIIGSWCFLLYQRYLPLDRYPLRTQDLDILIPHPYKGEAVNLSVLLRELGFEETINLDGSITFFIPSFKVEFLAPSKGGGRPRDARIQKLAIVPQYIQFSQMLLEDPMMLRIVRGIAARLPAPSAFFLHKLLVSTRPGRSQKKEKDLRQAVYVGKYILSNSEEKESMLRRWGRFPGAWKKKVQHALRTAQQTVPLEQASIQAIQNLLN